MQLDDLIRLIRTRWPLVLAVTGTFVVLAWVFVPGSLPSAGRERFRATTGLVLTTGTVAARPQASQLPTYSVIATQGRVPDAVAKEAGISLSDLLARTAVTPSVPTSTLTVVATDRTPEEATRLANLLADALIRDIAEQEASQRSPTRASLAAQVDGLAADVGRLSAQPITDPTVRATLEATNRQLSAQRVKLADLDLADSTPPLRRLGSATAVRLDDVQVVGKLLAFPVRTLVAIVLGLGGSIGVLLMADRFDVRLHTKEAVEVAFGLPVLAEVPLLPRRLRNTMVVADAPDTAFSEAHRILRTSVEVANLTGGRSDEVEQHRPRLVVVTSADPNEGKTTTSANLAASFAEAGRSTLLVGADLRHSDLPRVLRDPAGGQLVSFGSEDTEAQPMLARIAPTRMEHLRLVTVEPPLGRPAMLLPYLARWLDSQRSSVDILIVDTPPLLVCNDASELIPAADAVVVVCRVGGTTADAAERCAEVLSRLRAKAIGVVMIGAPLRAPVRKVYGYGPPQERVTTRLQSLALPASAQRGRTRQSTAELGDRLTNEPVSFTSNGRSAAPAPLGEDTDEAGVGPVVNHDSSVLPGQRRQPPNVTVAPASGPPSKPIAQRLRANLARFRRG